MTDPLLVGAHAAGDRLRELAKIGARICHEDLFDRTLNIDGEPTEGHENISDGSQGFNSWGFDKCPHPDCVLVRELVPVPPQPPWKVALGFNTAWPVVDVLRRLADATEHLLRDHNCDAHGWEGVGIAVERARDIAGNVEAIQRLEAVSVPPAPTWQPIESAPKDLTEVLLWTGRRVVGSWSDRATGQMNWNDSEYTFNPTHWMSLPAPPSTDRVAAPAPSAPEKEG